MEKESQSKKMQKRWIKMKADIEMKMEYNRTECRRNIREENIKKLKKKYNRERKPNQKEAEKMSKEESRERNKNWV